MDSIVQNAVSAYKGKCCAIAMESSFDWEGFLFSWIVLPDELLLIKNDIQLASVNSYRCFISSDIINIPVSITQEMSGNEDAVRKDIFQLENTRNSELKNHIAHFGRRSLSNDFLGIKQKHMNSNLSWFKERYPSAVWQDKIKDCYTIAKQIARKEISKMVRTKELADELNQNLSSAKASAEYYGYNIDVERETAKNQVIFTAFSKPKVQLDSVCYVRMIKR